MELQAIDKLEEDEGAASSTNIPTASNGRRKTGNIQAPYWSSPSLSWLADTREEARAGIKKTVQDAIRILREEGREV